jgi:hypothetical protein
VLAEAGVPLVDLVHADHPAVVPLGLARLVGASRWRGGAAENDDAHVSGRPGSGFPLTATAPGFCLGGRGDALLADTLEAYMKRDPKLHSSPWSMTAPGAYSAVISPSAATELTSSPCRALSRCTCADGLRTLPGTALTWANIRIMRHFGTRWTCQDLSCGWVDSRRVYWAKP